MSPLPITTSNPVEQASSRAQAVLAEHNADQPQAEAKPTVDPKIKKRNQEFISRIETCKNYRRKLVSNWTTNIDYRRGKPFTSQADEDQISVNLDWMLTKQKQAALFSQIPQARINHVPDTLPKSMPWVANFERMLNDKLPLAGIEAAMDECMPDCINAAGIGVVLVSYESLTEDTNIPKTDLSVLPPQLQQEAMSKGTIGGKPIDMEVVPVTRDARYCIERISPSDFLWPINFVGSNFDNAPWIGRSGRITWSNAVQRFNLKEEDKEAILGEDRTTFDKLTHDVERDKLAADDMVGFDELWFKEAAYDPDAKSFDIIHHLVFVTGKEDPVIDETWKGQDIDQQDGKPVGAMRYPLRVLTLSYMTDEAIPPSDSSIGRPQVNEINKGRTQQILQRQRSLPVRWADINRIDPAIFQSLMRGTWQSFIPVQGDGSRVIGEVSRASMPVENFTFDKVAKEDLLGAWAVGKVNDQYEENKTDPNQNTSPYSTPIARERAKVGSFFCSIAEVLGGLMCLYEDPATFGQGFDPKFSRVLRFSILSDSTVLLDAGQKLSRINQFLNNYGKTGWVDLEPVLSEVATLVGLDPNLVIKAPQPKPPVEPNVSLRLTGVEDMLNPLTLGFLIKSGQAPSKEFIEQAKDLIQQAVTPPFNPQESSPGSAGQQLFMGGAGDGQTLSGAQPSGPPLPPPVPGPGPNAPVPAPPPPKVGEAHPQWSQMPQVNKRTESGGKQ